jgi:hypothetical protein
MGLRQGSCLYQERICLSHVILFLHTLENLFFIYNFLLGYIHYMGVRLIVTILIRLILYIIYIAFIVSPTQPPLHPT